MREMQENIIFKTESLWVIFTPRENGKCEYLIELHDFDNLDGYQGIVSFQSLNEILNNPNNWRRLIY